MASDPSLAGRNVFASMKSPVDPVQEITVVKAGYVTDVDGPVVASAAPLLGAHTDEILGELGYDKETIEALRQTGTIQ